MPDRDATVTYRRLMELPIVKRRELAAVMANDGEESRYGEFLSWLEADFARLDPAARAYLVAEKGGVIVGFMRLWHSPHIGEWLNDGMVVALACRRRGIGRQLLGLLLDLAWEMGAQSVIAHISDKNTASIRLHKRAGFRREQVQSFPNSYGTPSTPGRGQYRIVRPEPADGLGRITEGGRNSSEHH
jgi:RimJ/RimL family protein N-acetyltransferase